MRYIGSMYTLVKHLSPNTSDHIPILLEVKKEKKKRKKATFRFINYWAEEKTFLDVFK